MSNQRRNQLIEIVRHFTVIVFKVFPWLKWHHIAALARMRLIPKIINHYFFAAAFAGRHLSFFDGLIDTKQAALSDVSFYWKIEFKHFRGLPLHDPSELQRLEQILAKTNYAYSKKFYEIAINNFFMTANVQALLKLLDMNNGVVLETLSKAQIVGIYKFLLNSGKYNDWRDVSDILKMDDKAPELQIALLDIAPITKSQETGWRGVFQAIQERQKNSAQCDQIAEVLRKTDALCEKRLDLIDIRSKPTQLADFHSLIMRALKSKSKFGLIRLGDGEAYAFYAPETDERTASHALRERHWWGKTLSLNQRADIAGKVQIAIQHADIVGLPSAYRFARDIDLTGDDLMAERKTRDLVTVLSALYDQRHHLAAKAFVEDRINNHGFKQNAMAKLAEASTKTLIVSCWQKEQLMHIFPENTEYLVIPGQMKVYDGAADGSRLCDTYEDVANQIAQRASSGTLVLISAGIIGKIFVHRSIECGAVALDVGSTLDYMAGRLTRDPADAT